MNNPKVSIIVPVYNVEKYLPCCMDSLLNQTLADIEIILVDDGSPDNCPAMCDEYAKQDHRVKVIHKQNAGLGYARNSGLEIATGKYIAFVDSDDFVELNAYQKLYETMADKKADVVYFNCHRFDDQGNTWKMTSILKENQYQTQEDIRRLMLDMIANPPKAKNDQDVLVSVWSALYRNDIFKKHKLMFKSEREVYSEDLVFNLDYLLHSSNVISIPDALYNYRVNPSSLSRTLRPDRIDKDFFFYQYILEMLRTNNFGIDGYLRATRLFIGNTRANIRRYIQSSLSKREKNQWLREVMNRPIWQEIASSYPYRQLPLKYAIHFYLLHKGFFYALYCFSAMGRIR